MRGLRQLAWGLALPAVLAAVSLGSGEHAPPLDPTVVAGEPVPVLAELAAAPRVTPAAATAVTEPPEPLAAPAPVQLDLRVTRLTAPAAGIADAPVAPVPFDAAANTWIAPADGGLATPAESWTILANTAYVFGHQSWGGVPGVYANLDGLVVGDVVTVDAADRNGRRTYAGLAFRVVRMVVADEASAQPLVFPHEAPESVRLVLQTSVKEDRPGAPLLLDAGALRDRGDVELLGDLTDAGQYHSLFVFLELEAAPR